MHPQCQQRSHKGQCPDCHSRTTASLPETPCVDPHSPANHTKSFNNKEREEGKEEERKDLHDIASLRRNSSAIGGDAEEVHDAEQCLSALLDAKNVMRLQRGRVQRIQVSRLVRRGVQETDRLAIQLDRILIGVICCPEKDHEAQAKPNTVTVLQ